MKLKTYCPYCRHPLEITKLFFFGHTLYRCTACNKKWAIREVNDET